MAKDVEAGIIEENGPTDILTMALGTPEYPGRVRGVGGFVKPEAYFNLPKRYRKERSSENMTPSTVRKIIEEEKAKWELEKREEMSKQNAWFEEKLRILELRIGGVGELANSPKLSTQGSCSQDIPLKAADEIENVKKQVAMKVLTLVNEEQINPQKRKLVEEFDNCEEPLVNTCYPNLINDVNLISFDKPCMTHHVFGTDTRTRVWQQQC